MSRRFTRYLVRIIVTIIILYLLVSVRPSILNAGSNSVSGPDIHNEPPDLATPTLAAPKYQRAENGYPTYGDYRDADAALRLGTNSRWSSNARKEKRPGNSPVTST
jgi:hypothetical protein